jgi:hypothetical protein
MDTVEIAGMLTFLALAIGFLICMTGFVMYLAGGHRRETGAKMTYYGASLMCLVLAALAIFAAATGVGDVRWADAVSFIGIYFVAPTVGWFWFRRKRKDA